MAAPSFTAPFPPVAAPAAPKQSSLPAFLSPVASVIDRISAARNALALPEPGKAEDLGKEVKSEYSLRLVVRLRGVGSCDLGLATIWARADKFAPS